ncbi:CinA family protein [Chryseobacterium chendengshani]|uniref:CinA family protein n=1 Tax=Chryseobacterium sp. LJ756 TaxID=2864113 RepID=UPI001C642B69|nr:nicotinamide-nucleotide amidohydrolase family protein [Chryseobacterium sp. LJ756]MBW7674165.1 nicotinamide-nucleotide amidohydrolase family protein [Chryseobacterium sp. LJ756]
MEKGIIETVGRYLDAQKNTVSVAESVTSGYLQFLLSQITEASKYFKGGITAYTLQTKVKHLGIDKKEAEETDCVSQKIAQQMALEVSQMFETDWGIGVTGYATPVDTSDFKTFAYYVIVYRNTVIVSEKIASEKEIAEDAQIFYAESIMQSFLKQLEIRSDN